MIISRGRRYIFVHMPKTGGTALTLAMEERLMKDDIVIGDTPKAKKRQNRLKEFTTPGRLWKHSSLADIDDIIPADELDDFFIVMLVRNPWDRMVSYYHWLRDQTFEHPAVDLAHELEFEDFVLHPLTESSFSNSYTDSYLTDINANIRDAHFIRLEALETDLAPFEAHLGFKLGPIAQVNVSDRNREYRGYFNDETRTRIARICTKDIERFGYRF